jgi:hypothetical protein
MARKLPIHLISIAVMLGTSPAPAASSSARPQPSVRDGDADGLQGRYLQQFQLPGITDVAINPKRWEHYAIAWVLVEGPPPRVFVVSDTYLAHTAFDLPPGTDAQTIDYDQATGRLIVADDAHGRFLYIDARTGELLAEQPFPPAFEYPTGTAEGYVQPQVAADFGPPGSAGSLWFGEGFAGRLTFSGTIHPNGVALLPDAGDVEGDLIPSEFLVNDAENGNLIRVSDETSPTVTGTVEGPTDAGGTSPSRDVAVVPMNFAEPDEPGVHPILMSVPALHQVYYQLGTGGTWAPLLLNPDPEGRPVRVAVNCDLIVTTDFSKGVVSFYALEGVPHDAVCTEIANPFLASRISKAWKLKVDVKAYVDLGPPDTVVLRAEIDWKKKTITSRPTNVELAAGGIGQFKLGFSRLAEGTLEDAFEDRKRLKGRLELEVMDPAGGKAFVMQGVLLRKG